MIYWRWKKTGKELWAYFRKGVSLSAQTVKESFQLLFRDGFVWRWRSRCALRACSYYTLEIDDEKIIIWVQDCYCEDDLLGVLSFLHCTFSFVLVSSPWFHFCYTFLFRETHTTFVRASNRIIWAKLLLLECFHVSSHFDQLKCYKSNPSDIVFLSNLKQITLKEELSFFLHTQGTLLLIR